MALPSCVALDLLPERPPLIRRPCLTSSVWLRPSRTCRAEEMSMIQALLKWEYMSSRHRKDQPRLT